MSRMKKQHSKAFPLTRSKYLYLLAITIVLLQSMVSCTNKPKPAKTIATNKNQSVATKSTSPIVTDLSQLQIGKTIEQELEGGAVHSYIIQLEANQYLNAVVEQKGIDIIASVYNPDNEKVYEVDSPNGDIGLEPIYLISQTAGSYRLEIKSLDKDAKAGKYQASIIELRASFAADKDRVAGFKAFQEAVLLQAEGKSENLQLVIKNYEEAIEKLDKADELVAKLSVINALASLYKILGEYEKAEPLFVQIVELKRQMLGENHSDVANAINNLASLYYINGDYKKAESLFVKLLDLNKKIFGEEHISIATAKNNLALVYYNQGNYEKAEPLFTQVLDLKVKLLGENNLSTTNSINNLASLHDSKGDYKKAEVLYIKALEIRKNLLGEDNLDTATSINNLASLYYTKGDYEKAEPLLVQALKIAKQVLGENHPDISAFINNLASLYDAKGDYEKAEPLYFKALEMKKAISGEDHPEIASFFNNLASLYYSKGDYEKAEPLYIQTLEIRRKAFGDSNPDTASSINNLASLYQSKKDYVKAEPLLVQALEIRKQTLGENHPDTASSINNLALFYVTKGDYAKAENLCLQALAIRRQVLGENHPDTATSINNLGSVYCKKGEYERAENLLIQALELKKRTLGEEHPDTATFINNLAAIYYIKKDYDKAINYNRQANNIRENELAKNLILGSEKQKRAYLQYYNFETDITLSLHAQITPNNPLALQSALTEVLRRKGRSIDVVNQSIESLRKRSDPKDIVLLDLLMEKKAQLSNLTIQGLRNSSNGEYQKQLKTLQDEIDQLEYKISERSLEFRTQVQPITLEAVQQAIPQDTTLVEFASYRSYDVKTNTFGKNRYLVYLLNNQGVPQWTNLGETEVIDQIVDELRIKLRENKTDIDKEIKPLARKLDELIMQPVRKLAGKGKKFLIAPDGKLNLVPFAVLVDENNKFLVENYPISYLTSGRDLLRLQLKIESKQNPVIIGDPDFGSPTTTNTIEGSSIFRQVVFSRLAATEEEAKAIKELLPESQLLLHEQASEEALTNLNAPSILHIATHGFFLKEEETGVFKSNSTRTIEIIGSETALFDRTQTKVRIENPLLRSGIALAGANLHKDEKETGIFTALKTTALNLWGTKVVVLSACDTGVGEVKTGDGVYGLRRALVLAGSETQIMSLWPVSDQGTKDLMVNYYQRLQKGEGRADALRNVQLQFLKDPKHRHPFYWASFIQSGEWANLDGKR